MKKFISSLDKTSIFISWSMIGLAIVILLSGIYTYKKSGDDLIILCGSILAPAILTAIIIAMYALQPLSVMADNTSLTIVRRLKPIIINYPEIRTVRKVHEGEMAYAIRTFGNGGLFGYTGKYYNKQLGSMTWYCTQRKNYILIVQTNNKQIVVTPDDPDGFIRELQMIQPALVTN